MSEQILLPIVWFCLLGFLLTGYAVLDGIDMGVGILLPFVAKDQEQRGSLFTAIGPFWAGYEVWIVAAGGAMVAAFPRLYADSFSGFYLVLTLVLWLLIARGGSIEFRHIIDDPMWCSFWDFVFFASSALLALLFGAALGNVIQGVPLDRYGNFQGSFGQALSPYAIGAGILSVVLLAMHGSQFIAKRATGPLQLQSRRAGRILLPISALLIALMTILSFAVRPDLGANFKTHLWMSLLPLASAISLALVFVFQQRNDDNAALLSSSSAIAFLMASAGASLYPRLLPAYGSPANDLTIFNCAAPTHNLFTAMIAYLIGMGLILVYTGFVHRVFRGRMLAVEEH